MGPSSRSRLVFVAAIAVCFVAGCNAAAPEIDAGSVDASPSSCERARDLAVAGLGAHVIAHSASLALPPAERPQPVPSVWTDVNLACFDVRVDARAGGGPFPLFVFSGVANATFAVTDGAGTTTLPTATPVDMGGGVHRFDFLVPASWSSAFLVHSQACARSGEIETRRFTLAFDDAASTVVLAEGECVDCPFGCSGVRCASPRTHVATDRGLRPIASLRVGDLVWSADERGFVLAPLVRVTRTPVSAHHVVRVVLDTGAVLEMSPGHPLAEGGTFADLRPGTRMGEARVVSATRVAYAYDATYDVLPETASGAYVAEGVLVGSTLQAPRLARQGATGASPETKSAHP